MSVTSDHQTAEADGHQVTYTGPALVELPDHATAHVEVELLGGRNRWSVGGRIAEGPRWWRGELSWDGEAIDIRPGTQVNIELEDGRSAMAVVEAAPACDGIAVRGIEPPPFRVP